MLTDQLRASLASRSVIDQALGVIMTQQRCTATEAFDILRSASQNRNVKVREIADQIIASIAGQPPSQQLHVSNLHQVLGGRGAHARLRLG
ncbi:MAG: ANTAR domain-containing protein [Trebonia sp.]